MGDVLNTWLVWPVRIDVLHEFAPLWVGRVDFWIVNSSTIWIYNMRHEKISDKRIMAITSSNYFNSAQISWWELFAPLLDTVPSETLHSPRASSSLNIGKRYIDHRERKTLFSSLLLIGVSTWLSWMIGWGSTLGKVWRIFLVVEKIRFHLTEIIPVVQLLLQDSCINPFSL